MQAIGVWSLHDKVAPFLLLDLLGVNLVVI